MPDVSDIEEQIADARQFAGENLEMPPVTQLRLFDGIAGLLLEVIRELRIISEKLDNQPGRPGDD